MRRAQWAVVAVLASFAFACGGGTDENKSAGGMGAGTAGVAGGGTGGAGGGQAVCGNMIVETAAGEQCEQGVAWTTTCESLGMGSGVIMCNFATCKLMMMCQGVVPVAGADGSGSMAGTGG